MCVIIGSYSLGIGPSEETRVATFSTEKLADAYLKKSRMKNGKGFRKKSLLHRYDDAWVEYEDQVNVPHDPEL